MPPSSRPPPPRASPLSPESPTQSPDQFRPMGTRVGKPRPFQTRHPTSEPRAHPTTHAAATTSSHRRHSSHWSQRSRDRRTGTTSTLTQITNYPNTNANHKYRNAHNPNLPPKYTQVRSRPRPRLVLRTETRNRPRAQRLRQRAHDGDQTAKWRPMGPCANRTHRRMHSAAKRTRRPGGTRTCIESPYYTQLPKYKPKYEPPITDRSPLTTNRSCYRRRCSSTRYSSGRSKGGFQMPPCSSRPIR